MNHTLVIEDIYLPNLSVHFMITHFYNKSLNSGSIWKVNAFALIHSHSGSKKRALKI